MTTEQLMPHLIEFARTEKISPFVSLIFNRATEEVISCESNRTDLSPTFHAEIMSINAAAPKLSDRDWQDCVLVTTAEPCPMCQSAIWWAGMQRVYYGVSIPWLTQQGYRQLPLRASALVALDPEFDGQIQGGILEDACAALFQTFEENFPGGQ